MSENAMAVLRDSDGNMVDAVASPEQDAPKAKPTIGRLGDPSGFTCIGQTKLDGWAYKATPNTLRATVGTVSFELIHGMRVEAEVVRVQTRVVDNNGKAEGKGYLELDFRGKGASVRTTPAISTSPESDAFLAKVLGEWKAYRDANKYPIPLLTVKADATKSAANVED